MEDKDAYINSLLLGLFLMQGEIDRLNETLDLARKGELVYINNPQIKVLEAENKELAHYLACMTEQRNKANTCLQEIKEVVKAYMPKKQGDYRFSKSLNPSLYELFEQIIDLITKAESEG